MERVNGGSSYDLGRDFVGSLRLNFQHYLWKETLGYDLHPRIETGKPSEGLRVADVGTGTGIFLLGLARRLPPSCSFVGIDISDDQFPIPETIPENMTFRVADAMSEPPADLQGQFDIVHLRLFFCVVENSDPLPPLNFCLKLLKPGGFLQWDEYDPATTKALAVSPQAPISALRSMREGFSNLRDLSWVSNLDDFCATHGLQNVKCLRVRPPAELLKAYTQMVLVLYMEHASLHDANGDIEKGNRVRKLVYECSEELKQGGVCQHMLQIVIGQKKE